MTIPTELIPSQHGSPLETEITDRQPRTQRFTPEELARRRQEEKDWRRVVDEEFQRMLAPDPDIFFRPMTW